MQLTVDTIRCLRAAKFTEEQAEAIVKVFEQQSYYQEQITEKFNKETADNKAEILSLKSKELVTRGDLSESTQTLQKQISDVKLEIARTTIQTLIWIGVNTAFTLGIIAKGFHWW